MTQRYGTYKDSGVQWLGEIPGHWGCVRLNKLASLKTGTTPKFFENQLQEDTIDWYTPSDFTENFMLSKSQRRLNREDFDACGLNYIPSKSVLIIGIGGTAGKVACNKIECYSNQQITSIIPNERICYLYMMLYLRSIKSILLETAHYTTLPILNNSFLSGVTLPLPPLPEQQAIVSYLDDKCGKIDEWIAQKQKEVELLGEMKQRVIADAVTRGLDPNVKMKRTNIAWLPEVPEYWEMSKISSHFRQRNEKVSDKDFPALSVSKQGVTPQLENVALSNAEGASRKLVRVGDYAVNSRSDRKGSCGVSKYEGSVSLITIVLEPFGVDVDYIHYLFRSNPWVEEFYRNGRGIVADLWTTNYQMMKGMYFPVPPLSEQRSIVSYITERTAKIDKMVENVNREIEALKEYKQRLISDVVTGQIKVC